MGISRSFVLSINVLLGFYKHDLIKTLLNATSFHALPILLAAAAAKRSIVLFTTICIPVIAQIWS